MHEVRKFVSLTETRKFFVNKMLIYGKITTF